MGYRPEDIERMSVWQFNAAMVGWGKQHDDPDKMSKSEEDELWDWLKAKDDVPLTLVKKKMNGGSGRGSKGL